MTQVVKSFFDTSLYKKQTQNKGLLVYQDLVHHRFYELLSNSFPLFYEMIEESEFESVINKFMSYGANDLFIWKTPKEFIKFVKRAKLFKDKPYIYDVLLFEWVEIELMMKDYSKVKQLGFSWNNKYVKAKNLIVFKSKYKLIEKDFTKKETQYILARFDLETYEVDYMPLHEAFYLFVKTINNSKTLQEHLHIFAKEHELNVKEAKAFFEEGLKKIL